MGRKRTLLENCWHFLNALAAQCPLVLQHLAEVSLCISAIEANPQFFRSFGYLSRNQHNERVDTIQLRKVVDCVNARALIQD